MNAPHAPDEAIQALLRDLEAQPPRDPQEAAARLAAWPLCPQDLTRWADFDHPATDSYGRRLVHQGTRFELMVMSWRPGDYSAIHDHGAAQWGAVRYFGAADHVRFRLEAGRLSLQDRSTTKPDSVLPVVPSLIHLMGNDGELPFLTLHLYGALTPQADSITRGARIFDLLAGQVQRTDGGVFFCLPDALLRAREPGPAADAASQRLHHRLMRERARAMGDAARVAQLDDRLEQLGEAA